MSLERQGLKLAEVSAEVGKLTVENAHKQEAIDQLTMQKDLAEKALQEWKDKYSMLELHYKRLQDSIQPLSDQAQAQQSYKSLYEQVVVQNQQLHEALNQSNVKHEEQLKQVMEDVSAKDERRRTEIIRGHKQEILAKQIEITALKEELMQKDAVSEAGSSALVFIRVALATDFVTWTGCCSQGRAGSAFQFGRTGSVTICFCGDLEGQPSGQSSRGTCRPCSLHIRLENELLQVPAKRPKLQAAAEACSGEASSLSTSVLSLQLFGCLLNSWQQLSANLGVTG